MGEITGPPGKKPPEKTPGQQETERMVEEGRNRDSLREHLEAERSRRSPEEMARVEEKLRHAEEGV